MPEKSGVEEELCTPILAGVASGTPCCPEAGMTVAANVTIKSKCRCTFMMIPLHGWIGLLALEPVRV
jgi:hypothetical protein